MNILDDLKKIHQLDPNNVSGSIDLLSEQLRQAYSEAATVKIPGNYRQVKNIVINGMGGSAFCGYFLEALFGKEIELPITVTNSYHLPGWANKDTLFIASSYSGSTEETLAGFEQALIKKAKVLVVAGGGRLQTLAKQNRVPGYFFVPKNNPCGQPRIGLGYTILGLFSMLNKIGLVKINKKVLDECFLKVKHYSNQLDPSVPASKNEAKKVARQIFNKQLMIIAAEHLSANAHVLSNQINESAKNLAHYNLVPELNHHLMEGLSYPNSNKKNLMVVFMKSNLYSEKIQKRIVITEKVVAKNKVPFCSYKATGANYLEQSFLTAVFSGWLSYYLGILNGVDPVKIPWVDYFKHKLAK